MSGENQLDAEERQILDAFERGELKSEPGATEEKEAAREAAQNTFGKTKRVNLRLTQRDFQLAQIRAREEGFALSNHAFKCYSQVRNRSVSGQTVEPVQRFSR